MDVTTPSILVGYDGTPASERALTWAARTAHLRQMPLSVVVVEPAMVSHSRVWPQHWYDEMVAQAKVVLGFADADGATVTKHQGEVVNTLLGESQGCSMLVVGSAGHSRIGGLLLASVSDSTTRHARVPVVVVREHAHGFTDRILVGMDGSEPSRRALEFACSQAAATGQPVVLLRAWKPAVMPRDEHGDPPAALSSRLREEGEELAKAVAEAQGLHPEVEIEGDFVVERPGHALVDGSVHAGLVVVGSRGHGVIAETVLGSVSHQVLHKARCPVAVVH